MFSTKVSIQKVHIFYKNTFKVYFWPKKGQVTPIVNPPLVFILLIDHPQVHPPPPLHPLLSWASLPKRRVGQPTGWDTFKVCFPSKWMVPEAKPSTINDRSPVPHPATLRAQSHSAFYLLTWRAETIGTLQEETGWIGVVLTDATLTGGVWVWGGCSGEGDV